MIRKDDSICLKNNVGSTKPITQSFSSKYDFSMSYQPLGACFQLYNVFLISKYDQGSLCPQTLVVV